MLGCIIDGRSERFLAHIMRVSFRSLEAQGQAERSHLIRAVDECPVLPQERLHSRQVAIFGSIEHSVFFWCELQRSHEGYMRDLRCNSSGRTPVLDAATSFHRRVSAATNGPRVAPAEELSRGGE